MMAGCQYRRTKSGEWVVMGPASVVMPGVTVSVTKKNGDVKDEQILRKSRSQFDLLIHS